MMLPEFDLNSKAEHFSDRVWEYPDMADAIFAGLIESATGCPDSMAPDHLESIRRLLDVYYEHKQWDGRR